MAGIAGLAALAAAPAQAATIAPTRACTNANAPTGFVGSGFTPGLLVTVAQPSAPAITAYADPTGAISGILNAPLLPPGPIPRTTTFSATDGINSAVGQLLVTQPGLDMPASSLTRVRTTFHVRGLEPGQRVYVHLRRSGRWIRTRSFGVAGAPCGDLTFRSKLFRRLGGRPVNVYVDQVRHPSTATRPQAWVHVAVRRALPLVPERWNVESKGWHERTTG